MVRQPDAIGGPVGRSSELAILEGRLQALLYGQGSLVLLSGEAGIGKSTLLRMFSARAAGSGVACCLVSTPDAFEAAPLTPLKRLVEDLAARQALDSSQVPYPLGMGRQVNRPFRLFRSVVATVHGVATLLPLIVMFDDLHRADRDTLQALELLTRDLETTPLMVIGTYRSDHLGRRNPLYGYLPLLQRNRPVELIHLAGFDVGDIGRLIESRAGSSTPELAAYLLSRSEGKPLLASELLCELMGSTVLGQIVEGKVPSPAGAMSIPETIQQLVCERVGRAGPEAAELLDAASAFGIEWEVTDVRDALDWPEELVERALAAAIRSRIVAPKPGSPGAYRFRHDAYRETIYGLLPPHQASRLHARVESALSRRPRSVEANGGIWTVAYHAIAGERWPDAVRGATEAGDLAREHLALHSAIGWYEHALVAARRAEGANHVEHVLALHDRLGRTYVNLQQYEDAEAEFTQFVDTARACGDRYAEAQALCWLSFLHARLYWVAGARSAAVAAARIAEGIDDDRLRAGALFALGIVSAISGDLEAANIQFAEAGHHARVSGDRRTLTASLTGLARVAILLGDYRRAEELAAESVNVAQEIENTEAVAAAYSQLGFALIELGHYSSAARALSAGLAEAEASGDGFHLAQLHITVGWLHRELGDVATAIHYDHTALDIARRGRADPYTDAERHALLSLVSDEIQIGRVDAAMAHLRDFERVVDHRDYARYWYLNRYQLLRAEIALLSGDAADARWWADEALRLSVGHGMRRNTVRSRILGGRALLGLGQPRQAVSVLREAMELADEIEHGSQRWRARWWLGQALQAAQRQPLAAKMFIEAETLIEQGAADIDDTEKRARYLSAPLVSQVRAALQRELRTVESALPAGLTAREVEVLALMAQGATNAEIAKALGIGVPTANSHVSSILSKTDSANRAAAVAFALRQGLV